VGDIIIDGDDIFGDGVNVAARLQTLAEPGGICVSRVVRDQVLDKLSFTFEDLGPQDVKNIARPVEVYRGRPGERRTANAKPRSSAAPNAHARFAMVGGSRDRTRCGWHRDMAAATIQEDCASTCSATAVH